MEHQGPLFPLIVATLVVGVIWSLFFGEYVQWIPIMLALGVVGYLWIQINR